MPAAAQLVQVELAGSPQAGAPSFLLEREQGPPFGRCQAGKV